MRLSWLADGGTQHSLAFLEGGSGRDQVFREGGTTRRPVDCHQQASGTDRRKEGGRDGGKGGLITLVCCSCLPADGETQNLSLQEGVMEGAYSPRIDAIGGTISRLAGKQRLVRVEEGREARRKRRINEAGLLLFLLCLLMARRTLSFQEGCDGRAFLSKEKESRSHIIFPGWVSGESSAISRLAGKQELVWVK